MEIKYVEVKSESWEREGKKKLEGGTKSQVQVELVCECEWPWAGVRMFTACRQVERRARPNQALVAWVTEVAGRAERLLDLGTR